MIGSIVAGTVAFRCGMNMCSRINAGQNGMCAGVGAVKDTINDIGGLVAGCIGRIRLACKGKNEPENRE